MCRRRSLVNLDLEYLIIGYREFVETKYQPVPALALDFRIKIFLINRFDGRFLLDGVLALLLVTLETFDKLDVVVDCMICFSGQRMKNMKSSCTYRLAIDNSNLFSMTPRL